MRLTITNHNLHVDRLSPILGLLRNYFQIPAASPTLAKYVWSHTSLSCARRLGSGRGVPSTNNLVALSLMCSMVERRSCVSSCRVGSRSPSVAIIAFAQSSRIRSSILRCGGDMNRDVSITPTLAFVGCCENRRQFYSVYPTKPSSFFECCETTG